MRLRKANNERSKGMVPLTTSTTEMQFNKYLLDVQKKKQSFMDGTLEILETGNF